MARTAATCASVPRGWTLAGIGPISSRARPAAHVPRFVCMRIIAAGRTPWGHTVIAVPPSWSHMVIAVPPSVSHAPGWVVGDCPLRNGKCTRGFGTPSQVKCRCALAPAGLGLYPAHRGCEFVQLGVRRMQSGISNDDELNTRKTSAPRGVRAMWCGTPQPPPRPVHPTPTQRQS